MEHWKQGTLAALALIGSAVAEALGGWDVGLQTLVFCMAADWLTGLVVAGVFRKSAKSDDGALSSRAGFQGICKKGAELVLVLVAVRLDVLMGGAYVRTAVLLFLVGNEGLSVLENLGLMGVPYPTFLKNALEVLKDRGEHGGGE